MDTSEQHDVALKSKREMNHISLVSGGKGNKSKLSHDFIGRTNTFFAPQSHGSRRGFDSQPKNRANVKRCIKKSKQYFSSHRRNKFYFSILMTSLLILISHHPYSYSFQILSISPYKSFVNTPCSRRPESFHPLQQKHSTLPSILSVKSAKSQYIPLSGYNTIRKLNGDSGSTSSILFSQPPFYDDQSNDEDSDSNDQTNDENQEDPYKTLSEFLKEQQQQQQQSSKISKSLQTGGKITGNIRDRVKRWLKFNRAKKDNIPVQPIRLDDNNKGDNEENTNYENFSMNESDYTDEDLDERTRARNLRQEQKEKRLQKIMNELNMQLQNSPDDLVKNIESSSDDEDIDSNKDEGKAQGDGEESNTQQPNVIRPNFDALFDGVPGLDDLLGISSSNNNFGEIEEAENQPNFEEPSEISNDIDDDNDDVDEGNLSAKEKFKIMEEAMRKVTGLTTTPEKKDVDDESNNASNENNIPVKSREEINLEALQSLEALRRKKYGDNYTPGDDMNSIRNKSTSSNTDAYDPNVIENEQTEDLAKIRFEAMEKEMRKVTGLTKRPDNENEDDNEKKKPVVNENVTNEDAKIIREELSAKALSTLESLRRKKLGDQYTELDKEQIMQKMKELREENDGRDLMQNDDVFLGDDDIASWNTNIPDENTIYNENPYVEENLPGNDDNQSYGEDVMPKKGDFDLFNKRATASDQMYRTIAARSGGETDNDKRSQWEAFLQKEEEMRQKMGMIKSEEDDEQDSTNSLDEPEMPNTPFFTENLDDTDIFEDESNENDPLEEDDNQFMFEETKEASVSSQIYRSIAAKKGARDLGTEADFQAYFEKEAEMRKKMGMASSDDENDKSADGTVDLSNVFSDFGDDIYRIDDTPKTDNPSDSNFDSSLYQEDSSLESWLAKKEAALNIDDTDNYYDQNDRPDNADNFENQRGNYGQDDKVPDTPYFQDYMDDESDVNYSDDNYFEDRNGDSKTSESQPSSSEYGYGPSEIADLLGREILPSKSTGETFSSYNVRKQDLLETTELSVQDLNALSEFDPLAKLSMKMKPDSAFGSIFRLEGTLVDTTEMQMEAWMKVAEKHDFEYPTWEEVQRAQLIKADDAVRSIFFWTYDIMESRDIALSHYDALQEIFGKWLEKHSAAQSEVLANGSSSYLSSSPPFQIGEDPPEDSQLFVVNEGVFGWLQRLRDVSVPCAVMSQLDRTKLDSILTATKLDKYFPEDRRVSSNCGYARESQEMLGAALRIQRRPDHCVVFDTTPSSSVAAHDVDMKSVALMGLYAIYELNTADLTTSYFNELSVINIRRLFGDENYDEPLIELEIERPKRNRSTRTWAEGDRL